MSDVTQEDRVAAAKLDGWHEDNPAYKEFLEGKYDKGVLVQAFARHRQATASSLAAENERLDHAVNKLTFALTNICDTYEANNPSRLADFHHIHCPCMRCAVDMGRAALMDG